ncbi:MAG: phage Gp37/Gp68 family protein [Tetrasphaera jenkinsii]|jgi:hypothetical protein|nr:phage Gp37/Gp68 family protein [Tetrasphaera jenkinsii]
MDAYISTVNRGFEVFNREWPVRPASCGVIVRSDDDFRLPLYRRVAIVALASRRGMRLLAAADPRSWLDILAADTVERDLAQVATVLGLAPPSIPLDSVAVGFRPDWLSVRQSSWPDMLADLYAIPAARHFLDFEALRDHVSLCQCAKSPALCPLHRDEPVAFVRAGGGAEPAHPDWFRSLRDECAAAGVPFVFSGWGRWRPDEWFDADGVRHMGRMPTGKEANRCLIHRVGTTALHPRNEFNPIRQGHPGWNTVMVRTNAAAGRDLLDGVAHSLRSVMS